MRLVATTVDDAGNRLDPEVAIPWCAVPGQRRRTALDVESVVSGSSRDVPDQEAVAVLCHDHEPIAAVSDAIAPDRVVGAAECRVSEPKTDARSIGAEDRVAGDEVAAPIGDADAVATSGHAVFGDDVSDARTNGDADAVLDDSIPPDLVVLAALQDEAVAAVARHHVSLDPVGGRLHHVDGVTGVASERVAHDPEVSCAEQGQADPKTAADRAIRGVVS